MKTKKSKEEIMRDISKERGKLESVIEKTDIEDLSKLVPISKKLDKLINQYIKGK